MNKQAVVLLSGGLDSTTTLAYAVSQGFAVHALTVDYGQKSRFEIDSAHNIARHYKVLEHKKISLDLSTFGGSSLTTDVPIERNRDRSIIGTHIPTTYVPARNTVLLSLALSWADALAVNNIFIGVNAVDAGGYPDCRKEFIDAFTFLANTATRTATEGKAKIIIHTPLISLSKAQIIQMGLQLNVDYSMTCTCYDPAPEGRPCGVCDSCILRQHGFMEAKSVDPLLYVNPLKIT